MEFKKKELVVVLEVLKQAVGKEGLVEVLANICFRDGKITAHNCSVGVIADFDIQGLECLIPFERFYVFVKGCGNDKITIELKDDKIYLQAGKSKSTLMTGGGVENFPDFADVLDKKLVPAPDILTGFKLCEPFAARKASKLELAGIHIIGTFVEATDAQRIARYDVGEQILSKEIDSIIISSDVVKLCTKFKSIQSMYIDSKVAIFKSGDCLVFGGIVEGNYPPVHKYYPDVKKFMDFPKDELRKGLTTVGDFTGDVIDQSRCEVEFGDTLVVKYEDSIAKITESFNFGQKYPEMTIKINPYHFNVMLNNCDLFSFFKGALYGESEDGRFRCVLAFFV